MTLACVSCFLVIFTDQVEQADTQMSTEDVQRCQDKDITAFHSPISHFFMLTQNNVFRK